MAHKHYGGLGVSSLYALNRALLFKWIWPFLSSQSCLWLSVIKAIHGPNGSLYQPPPTLQTVLFGLRFIKQTLFNLELQKDVSVAQKSQNPDFVVSFQRRPIGCIEESQFQELSLLLSSVVLSSSSDCWSWTLNCHGDFSVKSAREEIDKHLLITSSSSTGWSKLLRIKLNVFAWRMFLDKLTTRINLSNRGLDESWFNGLWLNSLQKLALEASFFSMWWRIWKYRIAVLFSLRSL
ncbi:ribonuclease H protein [Artemisia annua]|uniref:Ribonuclease H protein n=1 Tax=Artemisia annua TaxID=35608 RepID=A0A2U1P5L8_ARTAN|nr:ribonuclease H protein [Artemisia annua]